MVMEVERSQICTRQAGGPGEPTLGVPVPGWARREEKPDVPAQLVGGEWVLSDSAFVL